ncbi:MAG: metallophosphoesterase [Deltaproteobacteria bacterium]|nr:metallophosphoesterase [Deltaproteobacteria bacterium]
MRFVGTGLLLFVLLIVPVWAWLRYGHRTWWEQPATRWAFFGFVGVGVSSYGAWALARYLQVSWERVAWVSGLVSACLLVVLALNLTLPISAALRWILHRLLPRHPHEGDGAAAPASTAPVPADAIVASPPPVAVVATSPAPAPRSWPRRQFLELAAASAPATALAASFGGVAESFSDPDIPRVELAFAGLPADLEGLRVLQLTDLHLGIYRQLDHLERVLERAAAMRPHLVVLTGDVADDLDLLPDALRLAEQVRPSLGAFACLGNHEHYRGLREVLRAHERSGVDLLRDEQRIVRAGRSRLRIAGSDDPARLHGSTSSYYAASTRSALGRGPSGDFSLLLCHRPAGATAAARRGASLVLSGHTHGAQVGAAGRSAFEPVAPGAFLRGPYKLRSDDGGNARAWLYTSSGFGHWLPFRLGCAAEAPLIELRSA